jgi:hypothetical protein
MSRAACRVAIACVLVAETAFSLDLDVTSADIEAVLKVARSEGDGRILFHQPYVFPVDHPVVERVEAITETRRLMLIAESRIAAGEPLFAQGLIPATEALKPWRRRVAIVAVLRFGPQGAFVTAPPVDIQLGAKPGELTRLDIKSESEFGLPSRNPSDSLPVVGARAEALFDAVAVGQSVRTAIVRMQQEELVRVSIDFRRFP